MSTTDSSLSPTNTLSCSGCGFAHPQGACLNPTGHDRLQVTFKLRRDLPLAIVESTDYIRTLSLLARAWHAGSQPTHSRLVQYLERKGSMVFVAPLSASKLLAKGQYTTVSSLLVGKDGSCPRCRRCSACDKMASTGACLHAKLICPCPFPRRMFPWGKIEHDQDIEALDKLDARLSQLIAKGEIDYATFTKKRRWVAGMVKRTHGKLFAIAQRMQEAEGPIDSRRTRAGIGKDVSGIPEGAVLL